MIEKSVEKGLQSPPKTTEIPSAIQGLNRSLQNLMAEIGVLEDKLVSVIGSDQPKNEGSSSFKACPATSPLAKAIDEYSEEVTSARLRINALNRRIQL